jgi:hypothetical protein
MLNLKQMRETVENGKSVLYKGRLISTVEKLPTAAELASTEEEKAAAAGDIDAQIAALQQQKAGLTSGKKDSSSETNSDAGGSGSGDGSDDTIEELMKHTRAQLVEKAGEVGVEVGESDTKTQIAEAILAKQKAE